MRSLAAGLPTKRRWLSTPTTSAIGHYNFTAFSMLRVRPAVEAKLSNGFGKSKTLWRCWIEGPARYNFRRCCLGYSVLFRRFR